MRLQHELVLAQARFLGGKAAPGKEDPKVALVFRAALTTEVAEAFGCRELVYAGDVPRSGVASMALEGGEMDCEIHLRHDNLAWSGTAKEMGHYIAKFEGTGPALIFQVKLTGHEHLVGDLARQVKIDPLELTLKPAQMALELADAAEGSESGEEDDDTEDDGNEEHDGEEDADILSDIVQ